MSARQAPPPPPIRPNNSSTDRNRRAIPAPPPPGNNSRAQTHNDENEMQSPINRLSTIPVQSAFRPVDFEIPEPPQTEAGKWEFHSQKEFPPPPPFEKRLRRYPTGAETGCSTPIDLSHLQVYQ